MNILWIKDGKKGHEKQVKVLLEELTKTINTSIYEENYHISSFKRFFDFFYLGVIYLFNLKKLHNISKKYSQHNIDIVIGAGRNTHARILLIKRLYGNKVKAISILTPGIFKDNFDFICAPNHDKEKLKNCNNAIFFEGSLARVSNSNTDEKIGLIGLGGVNKHFIFNENDLIKQIEYILSLYPNKHWYIYVSRRTPNSMVQKINLLTKTFPCLTVADKSFDGTLQKASMKFVTQDSVNMVYESLSSVGQTFLFSMAEKKQNKVTKQINSLIQNKQIGYIENTIMSDGIRKIKIQPQNQYNDIFAEVEKVSFQLINKLNLKVK